MSGNRIHRLCAVAIAGCAIAASPAFGGAAFDLSSPLTMKFGPLSDKGGTGSATVIFESTAGTSTVTAEIYNTSPIVLDGGSGLNAPALTGLGFGLIGEGTLDTWSLWAYTIATDTWTDISSYWIIGDSIAGMSLEYVPCVKGGDGGPNGPNCGGIDGALYNSALGSSFSPAGGLGYFTKALLTLKFDSGSDINLDASSMTKVNDNNCYSFVRMQNVGTRAAGSLKMCGETKETPQEIPEPLSVALLSIGLLGMGVVRRDRRR